MTWLLGRPQLDMLTTKKLNNQLLAVASPFAGYYQLETVARLTARIRSGVISAGYSQVIPNQPTENQELNKNSMRTDTTCAAVLVGTISYRPARMAIVAPIKIAVHNMSLRRPNRSITKIEMAAVRK